MTDKPLLEVKDLVIYYETDDGVVRALSSISIHIGVGETLGLVGETGTGKITLAKGIMGLIPNPPDKALGGEMIFEGQDLSKLSANGMEAIRGRDISMIFQDPMASLNPVLTVGEQIIGVVESHNTSLSKQGARKWAEDTLERVGIPAERFGEYPHQFSGSMKQRMVTAITLACDPELFIADEPITTLDVAIQAQVLETIYKLKFGNSTSMVLIIHDLGVVAQNHNYVVIIYAGEVVEYGTLRGIYKDTRRPHTERLFGSIPSLTNGVKRLQAIDGMMLDPAKLSEGCVFCERCRYAVPECSRTYPGMVTVGGTRQVRYIRYR